MVLIASILTKRDYRKRLANHQETVERWTMETDLWWLLGLARGKTRTALTLIIYNTR